MTAAEREAVILDATEKVLLASGLAGTTMSAVAREAGMSKRTLYAVFDGRTALFGGVLRRLGARVVRPLDPEERELSLSVRLKRLLGPDLAPGICAAPLELVRAVLAEAPRAPELVELLIEEGPRSYGRAVRHELDRAVARQEIRLSDTGRAADLLLDMALPCSLENLLRGTEGDIAGLRERIELAVDVFLSGADGRV
ncbi:TetR/AcrR family transcriptional regulator [Rhodovulum sulfidophilum]|uniref:TetR/AcrR family transcriptional regulator n=1 Tax=Rhodovulum sulfidophilum TaxID=35806 RepID=UPI001F183CE9|nr:TetR/AcrR family transcriptional regulator [Rhodovulum sulfidophilum]MCE8441589.1 TetR/AcrR family transcriptional regulator [Rhodovulum sulfidophilum]